MIGKKYGRYESTKPLKYTRLYRIWMNMMNRCNNQCFVKFARYGGRGISICEEWDSFETFEDWAINNGYRDDLTIDRIDNNKGYCPDNCRWADAKQQANNRRTSVTITYKGETHTLAEWADLIGVNYKTFTNRIYRGYSLERIFAPTKTQFASHRKG